MNRRRTRHKRTHLHRWSGCGAAPHCWRRLLNLRTSQSAPPATASTGSKPTPATGPGTPTTAIPAKAAPGSPSRATETTAKAAEVLFEDRMRIDNPQLCLRFTILAHCGATPYCWRRLLNLRTSQSAPPATASKGSKPTPATGPGTPTAPAKAAPGSPSRATEPTAKAAEVLFTQLIRMVNPHFACTSQLTSPCLLVDG